jgi:ketosteroid isomerase-like protein
MRNLILILCCIAVSGCGSARTAPLDLEAVRSSLTAALQQLDAGINREDPLLASRIVSRLFVMDSNISIRYLDAPWEGQGRVTFRDFFTAVSNNHANMFHQIEITDIELSGEIAIVRADVSLNSTRIDRSPPESYLAEGEDLLVFQREAGSWLLIDWAEAPPLPDHDQGLLEDL